MIKFVYLLKTSSLSVINKVYNHDASAEDIRVYSFDQQPNCSKYRPETLLVPSDEIHVL